MLPPIKIRTNTSASNGVSSSVYVLRAYAAAPGAALPQGSPGFRPTQSQRRTKLLLQGCLAPTARSRHGEWSGYLQTAVLEHGVRTPMEFHRWLAAAPRRLERGVASESLTDIDPRDAVRTTRPRKC